MKPARILIGGIGNIFLGDDAFGCEVARQLANHPLPDGVRVVDFGIRGLDLTYALLEDYQRVILVDAVARGGKPGTLYVIEPALPEAGALEMHEMAPAKVLAAARGMGARLAEVLIIGCEPENLGAEEEPRMGLSPVVESAVEEAVGMIKVMVTKALETVHA